MGAVPGRSTKSLSGAKMTDLRPPEQPRISHTDERLRSYPADRAVAVAIVIAAVLLWARDWGPVWLQVSVAVLAFLGAISATYTTARDLFAKLKTWTNENE